MFRLRITRFLLAVSLIMFSGGCRKAPDGSTNEPEPVVVLPDTLDPLTVVPAHSDLVLVAPNLTEFVENLSTSAEMVSTITGHADTYGRVFGGLDALGGLISDGPVVAFLPDVSQLGPDGGPFTLLLPIADYQAFIESAGGSGGDPVEIELPMGTRAFSRQVRNLAVLAVDEATLSAFEPTLTATFSSERSDVIRAVLEQSQISVLLNMDEMRPFLSATIDMSTADGAQGSHRSVLRWFARNTSWLAFGLDLTPELIGASMAMEFADGSVAAGLFSGGEPAHQLWADLPAGDFLLGAVANLDGMDLSPLSEVFAGVLNDPNGPLSFVRRLVPVQSDRTAVAQAFYLPTDADGVLARVGVMHTENTSRLIDAFRAHIEGLNGSELTLGQFGDLDEQSTRVTSSYEPASVTSAGRLVDRFRIEETFSLPDSEQPLGSDFAEIARTFGASVEYNSELATLVIEGLVFGEGGRVITINPTAEEARFQQAIEAAANDGLFLDPVVTEVQPWRLMGGASIEVIVNTNILLQWLRGWLDATLPMALPETEEPLSPIAAFVYSESGATAIRVVIPLSNIRWLVNYLWNPLRWVR